MATNQMKSTNYFPHDSNARNDEKLVRLRMKHGAAGYGVYFMILERLREDTDYMSAKDYNMIAFDLRVDAAIVKSVVEDFGLFAFTDDGKHFYSESFFRRMKVKDTLHQQYSERSKVAANARWQKSAPKTEQKSDVNRNVPEMGKTKLEQAQASTPQPADNDTYFKRFFAKANKAKLEVLLMNFGMKPDDLSKLRKLAKDVIAEWSISDKKHADYTDWSQHLIATMRIKYCRTSDNDKVRQTTQPPTSADYSYDGGFGSKDM